MPGHNHYPWCTCGWCVKFGRGRSSSANVMSPYAVRSYFDRYSARRFLQEHGAHRSSTACFVAPNARCPVCQEQVFYYQNAAGSRVFFDELSPPWSKHPCTDTSPRRSFRAPSSPPARRPRGLMLELLEAAQTVSDADLDTADDDPTEDTWVLAEIVSLTRTGWQITVLSEFIGSSDQRRASFEFDSASEVLKPGDIISVSDREISIFDLSAMKPSRYKFHNLQHLTPEGGD